MGTTGKTVKKEKFDTSAFVFETDLSALEEKLLACYAELEDLLEYQQPDSEQRKRIEELKYWLMIWERDLPEAKKRGLSKVPLCAIEGRVFGTYEKKIKKVKKMSDICFETVYWDKNQKYQRRIVCAANRYKNRETGEDVIIPCVRHYSKEHAVILKMLKSQLVTTHVVEPNQGFIDQYGNYWTREEAMIIAMHAGQVRVDRGGPSNMLFSEDLY